MRIFFFRGPFETFLFTKMGARGSTPRSVHLENDSPASVIDVSEAVVDRLKGLHTKGLFEYYFFIG